MNKLISFLVLIFLSIHTESTEISTSHKDADVKEQLLATYKAIKDPATDFKTFETAHNTLVELAKSGVIGAWHQLGIIYSGTRHSPKNFEKAKFFLRGLKIWNA